MSARLCCVSVIGLCYILCILQHFVRGAVFSPDTVYVYQIKLTVKQTGVFNFVHKVLVVL